MKTTCLAAAIALCAIPTFSNGATSDDVTLSSSYKFGSYLPTTYSLTLDTYNGSSALDSVVLKFDVSSLASSYSWNNNNPSSTAEGYVFLGNSLSGVTIGTTTYTLSDLDGVWQSYTSPLGMDGTGSDIATYDIASGLFYDSAILTISDPTVVALFTSSVAGSSSITFSFVSTLVSSMGADVSNVVVNGTTPSATLLVSESFVSVPEPSTYALLLGVGTLGLVGYRRFRRK